MTLAIRDGTLDVVANTSGFDVVNGPPPRVLPTLGKRRTGSGPPTERAGPAKRDAT